MDAAAAGRHHPAHDRPDRTAPRRRRPHPARARPARSARGAGPPPVRLRGRGTDAAAGTFPATDGDIASGFVQERGLVTTGPVRRAWILLNLRESIPIPETGGRAQSVRFSGEYRCAQREWRPLEGAWFALPNAQQPVHAERIRSSGFRPAPAGTLGGAFLDAACGL